MNIHYASRILYADPRLMDPGAAPEAPVPIRWSDLDISEQDRIAQKFYESPECRDAVIEGVLCGMPDIQKLFGRFVQGELEKLNR